MNRSILALHTRGSFVVRAAIRQLNDKDVRQRRRAVRKLFEVDDPDNLYDFIDLLDDKEAWYREKSMEAIVKWANNGDEKIIQKCDFFYFTSFNIFNDNT